MDRIILCDINCDMGEGIGNDEALMPFIHSANIACGFHAGDAETMKRVVELCVRHKVNVGAHPSYPDRENFGRKDLIGISLQSKDVREIVAEQVFNLEKIAKEAGARLHHVKPHGALYNRAAWDADVASSICSAIKSVDSALILYGLSGSEMKTQAEAFHIGFMNEVFADRTYQGDGSLTARTQPNALITDDEQMIKQVLQMINEGVVTSVAGKNVRILAETICVHGDGLHAIDFAKKLHDALNQSEQKRFNERPAK